MERVDPKILAKHWHWQKDGDNLAWLTFDKQGESANTFSREALNELSLMLEEIAAARPRGLIIRSGKDSFIGGADIQEFANFNGPEDALAFTRLGWDVFQKLHDLPFPTTAMVNGFCMGGGMEMALACNYIVALDDPKTRFAQPEVMVGVIPAWHAMQWLPQRVGPAAAMDLLLTGKSIDAKRAKRIGLADQAVPLRIFENTARMITLEAPPRKKLSLLNRLMLGPLKGVVAAQASKQVARKARREHYPVPYAIIDIWKNFGGGTVSTRSMKLQGRYARARAAQPGFSGAAALDPQGRVVGMVGFKTAAVTAGGARRAVRRGRSFRQSSARFPPGTSWRPWRAGRGGVDAVEASLVRVICVRK